MATTTLSTTMTFGVEIETYGISCRTAAEAIHTVIGGRVVAEGGYYGKWTCVGPDGRKWTAMLDASIVDTTGRGSAEVVTPILTLADLDNLQAVVRAVHAAGGRANESCGVHVHLGASFFDAGAVVRLTKMVHKWQPWIEKALEISGRRLGQWCKATEPSFVRAVESERRPTMDRLSQIWYGGDTYRASSHYDESRYHGLNLHAVWQKGTIEFRWFNGTTHAGKIKAYVQFVMALGQCAIDGKAASAKQTEYVPETAGFDFRQLMHRLGVSTGAEFATLRHHLLGVDAFKGTFTWSKVKAAKAARAAARAGLTAAAA